jgi:hypothetical protein
MQRQRRSSTTVVLLSVLINETIQDGPSEKNKVAVPLGPSVETSKASQREKE